MQYHHSFSVLFFDLDHFKALNDGYGHSVGDTVLREFAATVSPALRTVDTVGRWGGEEFIAILPETDEEGALTAAERVRAAIATHIFQIGGGVRPTCSLGVATFPSHATDRESLVNAADHAMYAAKKLGRNQVRSISDPLIQTLETMSGKAGLREETALLGVVEALSVLLEARDGYTGQHTQRVGTLTLQLALKLGLDTSEAHMIELAGQLHDVGKIGIPDAVLHKPGPLTEEEWEIMRQHSTIGAEVISHIPALRGLASVIRAHHERWDGTGYPDQLVGETIPWGARIIAVVDAYEAMTTDRPYQKARSTAWAIDELHRCAGTQFDRQVVEALEEMLTTVRANKEFVEAA